MEHSPKGPGFRSLLAGSVIALTACMSAPVAPPPQPAVPQPDTNGRSPDKSGDWIDDLEAMEPVYSTVGRESAATQREALRTRSVSPVQDFLPYIDVAIEPDVLVAGIGPQLQDRYTRIQIVTLDPDSYDVQRVAGQGRKTKRESRNYQRESRGWLRRTLSGSRNVTRTLIAQFDVSNPDIQTTKALFSASFESDNFKGEAWMTNESIAVYATPYFKVGPNTTIHGRFRMQLSDERQSSAGANVMGALQTAANLIAPSSALVTYFNAPAMQQASTFLNNQSAALFGQSITEESTGAFAIRSWTIDPILVISASVPPAGNIRNSAEKTGVGKWAVYLDEPIASVLTAATNDTSGEPNFKDVSSADILAFQIGSDLRVYDYIFSRLDMSDRIGHLNETGDMQAARMICSRISRGLSEVGFTTYDVAATVWAASESDQFSESARAALQDPSTCEAMILWQRIRGS